MLIRAAARTTSYPGRLPSRPLAGTQDAEGLPGYRRPPCRRTPYGRANTVITEAKIAYRMTAAVVG